MSFFTKLKRRNVFRVGLSGRLSRVAVENVVTGPVAIYSNWIVCFFVVAVSKNSSCAPLRPRSRNRSTFSMRFI